MAPPSRGEEGPHQPAPNPLDRTSSRCARHRQKRIHELQVAAARPRFGTCELIRGNEFVEKVTNAGPDVWVVLHLFKDG